MDNQQRKMRRIEFVPPLPLRQEIEKYSGGNMSEFLKEAAQEKINRIKAAGKSNNKVSALLG